MNIFRQIFRPRVSCAGAVVFRINGTTLEFLVQKSRRNPGKWLFPKGHVEKGETKEEAALRELKEESGVTGKNLGFLHDFYVEYSDEIQHITFYLFQFSGFDGEPEEGRDPVFLDASSAFRCLSNVEYSTMLQIAIERLRDKVTDVL